MGKKKEKATSWKDTVIRSGVDERGQRYTVTAGDPNTKHYDIHQNVVGTSRLTPWGF